MTVVAVTFDGTRFNQVQDYTNWTNYGGSGAGGAVEPSLAYQNGQCAARKQSVTGGTLGGMQLNDASTVDMTATDRDLWFFKAYIADAFDVNTSEGVRIGIGEGGSGNSKSYNISGSTATNDAFLQYPARGGYILGAIDPISTFWPIATAGSIGRTVIDWFGCQGSWINGNAKSLNVAMDSIDIGVGLYLVGGTSTDPDASFVTYVEKDQDITTNRWGCCAGAGSNVEAWCILRAGGAIEFFDDTSIVAFKDGYHGTGFTGVLHELDTAASTFTMGATLIGEGKLYNSGAIDTRPDYICTGTTVTANYNLTGELRNFRNVTLTSKVDANGASIECQLLTQAGAEIQNAIIKCTALTSIAVLQDPTFGTTTDLHDTTFVQNGAGHAMEIDTAGDYTFTNIFFEDGSAAWGATTSASAMLDVTASSGVVNITVAGGTAAITYITAGATVNIIASVPVNIDGITEGSSVKLIARETLGAVTTGDTLAEGFIDSALNFNYAHNDQGSLDISVVARNQGIAVAAIADDGGAFTDETVEASSNATADMTLLPAVPVASDAYLFGHTEEFSQLKLVISTVLTQSVQHTIVWEYWNGAWVALSGVSDGTDQFEIAGSGLVSWTAPGDWTTTTVNGQGPLFYVRARLSVLGTITQVPIGGRVTLDVTRYLPYDEDREIVTGTGLSDRPAWVEDKISTF